MVDDDNDTKKNIRLRVDDDNDTKKNIRLRTWFMMTTTPRRTSG